MRFDVAGYFFLPIRIRQRFITLLTTILRLPPMQVDICSQTFCPSVVLIRDVFALADHFSILYYSC